MNLEDECGIVVIIQFREVSFASACVDIYLLLWGENVSNKCVRT